MTSPKVRSKTLATQPVYSTIGDLSPEERFSGVYRKIFSAKTEAEKWSILFALVSDLQGVPEGERCALLTAAVWRLAKANIATLSRRRQVESVLSIGHDAAEIVGDTLAGFGRLEAERIAVDAYHFMRLDAFKRGTVTHAAP